MLSVCLVYNLNILWSGMTRLLGDGISPCCSWNFKACESLLWPTLNHRDESKRQSTLAYCLCALRECSFDSYQAQIESCVLVQLKRECSYKEEILLQKVCSAHDVTSKL